MSIRKARAELQKWGETSERLQAQLDATRDELAQEQAKRTALVLPARTGDSAAKDQLAAHDARVSELRRDVGELLEAADDAEARRTAAETKLREAEQAKLDREVAAIEAEAAQAAARVDAGLEAVAEALRDTEQLIDQADKLRGTSLPRRVPTAEALRRALALRRVGDVHSVHRALHMSFSSALRFKEAGGSP